MDRRCAIITGASSGIGAATAHRFAGSYGGLVLHARQSHDRLARVAEAVRAKGTAVALVLGNLTDETLAHRLVATAGDQFGRLDVLVANAGFPVMKSFDEGSIADLDYAFRGNVFSFFSLVRASKSLLTLSPSGRVVAVGSFTSHVFRPDIRQFPMSAASKGALEIAVRSHAAHLASDKITVNCVVPGIIHKAANTDAILSDDEYAQNCKRIPLGRIGVPEDVAAAIEFLVSPEAGYITGQCLHVNGGLI
jgi:3-oxoacyl-[acyl-carrier protein] reductase